METHPYGVRGRRGAEGREEKKRESSESSDSSSESSGSNREEKFQRTRQEIRSKKLGDPRRSWGERKVEQEKQEGARHPLADRTKRKAAESVEGKMRKMEQELKEKSAEIVYLRMNLETEKTSLQKRVKRLEEDLAVKDEELDTATKAKQAMREELGMKERTMEGMGQKHREEIKSLEKKLKSTEKEKINFQKGADHYQGRTIQLEEENEELVKDINQLEDENEALQDSNDELEDLKQLCVAILTGERVDTATLHQFFKKVGGEELQLHVAVSLGVEQLVAKMRDRNPALLGSRNGRGWTPLQLATARGNPGVIQALWEQPAARREQPPLLHLAAANRHRAAAKLLKRKKMNKKARHNGVRARDVALALDDVPLANTIENKLNLDCSTSEPEPDVAREDYEELILYHPRSSPSPRNMPGAGRSRRKRGRRARAPRHSTSSKELLLPTDGDSRDVEIGSVEEDEERGQRRGEGGTGNAEWRGSGKREREDRNNDKEEETEPKKGRKKEEEEEERTSEGKSTDEEARQVAEFLAPLPLGLPNLGNTCYMNSVLQCLRHIQSLASHFSELQGDRSQGEVVRATVRLWASLRGGEGVEKSVRALKGVVGKRDENFRDFDQKEAHDFLSQLLDFLHADMIATAAAAAAENEEADEDADVGAFGGSDKPASFISGLFRVINLITITCPKTDPPYELTSNYEAPMHLSLPVSKSGPYSLEELVAKYYRLQRIDWTCDRCDRDHKCENETVIAKLPSVLVLHLSRVSDTATSYQKVRVTYPLTELVVGHTRAGTSRSYSLTAVCCHEGGMKGGHYRAFCRSGAQWFSLNDEFVDPVSSRVVRDRPTAHILFYEAEDTPL